MQIRNTLSSKPYSITEISAQSASSGVTQDSQIRLECLFQSFLGYLATFKHFDFFIQFAKHSLFGSFTQCSMFRKGDISKKIYATGIFSYRNFTWVEFKIQMTTKIVPNFRNQLFQRIYVFRHNDKIVRVADIIFYLQLLFHKLIKLIHVDIGKKLRCQITNRESFSNEKIGRFSGKTFNDFFHKPHRVGIFYFSTQKLDQNGMVNAIKKLSYVALERISCPGIIFRSSSEHCIQNTNALMCSFSNTTGKGMGYKSWFKNWVKDFENCMVQYSVPNRCLVNMSKLWVVNVKTTIRPMLVCLA